MNNENLQYIWSKGSSKAVRSGARGRVDVALRTAAKNKLPVESILIIGPQHGFEPERYREHGINNILCIEVSRIFVKDCRKKKIRCIHTSIEDWTPEHFDGVHASHVLEHCRDIKKAVENIKRAATWCFVEVPIESSGTSDKAHLSIVKSKEQIIDLFSPWKYILIKDKAGNFSGVFYG